MRRKIGSTDCEQSQARHDLWRVIVPRICEKAMLISGALLFITTWLAQSVTWGHRPPSLAENAIHTVYRVLFVTFTLPWLVYLVLFLRERLFRGREANSTRLWGIAMPVLVIFACVAIELSCGVPW